MPRILMVCLGNICRSPLAEGILKAKLAQKKIEAFVDSAGTSNYHIGNAPDGRTIKNAERHGIDIRNLRARRFTPEDFKQFDKIFVMDSSNYADVLALASTPEERNKVSYLLNAVYPNSNMNVPDPYFGGEQGFEHVFILLDKACQVIAETLE